MKLITYQFLYRLTSFLTDKTNGFHLFVKYKILFGTIILGLTNTACKSSKNISSDRDIPFYSEPTCYMRTYTPVELREPLIRNGRVRGTVLDQNNEPLIGVTISIKDTNEGTYTDLDGNFDLMASDQDTLVIKSIGYEQQEYNLKAIDEIPIVIKLEEEPLDNSPTPNMYKTKNIK